MWRYISCLDLMHTDLSLTILFGTFLCTTKKRKASEVDLEQGQFVASVDANTGKIRIRAKAPTEKPSTSGPSEASYRSPSESPATPLGSSTPADESTTPVIKRLKLKLGGESIS